MPIMPKCFFAIIILLIRFAAIGQVAPQADISNGIIHARLYLPDTAVGYYRATRFDWSGVMPVLEYKGHQFITQWFPKYAPTIHDAIMGPVESFGPIGWREAAIGGSFVQIGVGVLVRPDSGAYTPFKYYTIRDAGVWRGLKLRHVVGCVGGVAGGYLVSE